MSDNSKNDSAEILFSVSSIECVACTPYFKRELQKIPGIREVRSLVMMNKINVEFNPKVITLDDAKQEIQKIAKKAGFGESIVFSHV